MKFSIQAVESKMCETGYMGGIATWMKDNFRVPASKSLRALQDAERNGQAQYKGPRQTFIITAL